jgi:hypothetical protein
MINVFNGRGSRRNEHLRYVTPCLIAIGGTPFVT